MFAEYLRIPSAPIASHDSVSEGQIRISWQALPSHNVTGYRVVCSLTPEFLLDDIVNCTNIMPEVSQPQALLTDLSPLKPLYIKVQVERRLFQQLVVDEVSSPVSGLACPGELSSPVSNSARPGELSSPVSVLWVSR